MGRRLIQTYPPDSWVCPSCSHKHSKPHYALPDQIDHTKRPGEKGRIRFNRWNKDDQLADDTPIDRSKPMKGEPFDEDGYENPIFCSHCGFEADVIVLVRVGELPDMVDRFLDEGGIDAKKSLRELLKDFFNWLKKREGGL